MSSIVRPCQKRKNGRREKILECCLVPLIGRQRWADLGESEASLVYRVCSTPATQGYTVRACLKKKRKKKRQKERKRKERRKKRKRKTPSCYSLHCVRYLGEPRNSLLAFSTVLIVICPSCL